MSRAIRPLLADDVGAADALNHRVWGGQPRAPEMEQAGRRRIAHLIETDPGGAWAAERDGELIGVALALVREGLWGLSLLVVAPESQSGGVGRALLEGTLAYSDPAGPGLIVASSDARALRAYGRAGFALRPCFNATGSVDRRELPAVTGVQEEVDLELAAMVDRRVRGASHGSDLEQALSAGARMLVVSGRGYAVVWDDNVYVLAALDESSARCLLVTALADAPDGECFKVSFMTAEQGWAIELALAARLGLEPQGALCVRGHPGPLAPYLPSGAYL